MGKIKEGVVNPYYFAYSGARWRMIFRSEAFTDSESGKTLATSGSRLRRSFRRHNGARIFRARPVRNRIRRASVFVRIYSMLSL